ncbi:late control protein [Brucella anthropi]|uniref:Phage late control D family protein n=1 Tax=Brucella anthropi (strain ATCC 49188 / DSM 6882 / CCUG 24695 / JCM 21032 / LMG 3331 / NBRC 15819 / NCTC 12168 / Alc 37) TaxID=439375 RepID=A6WYZ8_BRUA4|nr:phage late control D family protein [Brucella anthropi]ABS14202.1 phage late control D family protein [Brucella anthropi ATCC 49188]QQC25724.1 late control protein [Brucella anthropi]SUA65627.1 Phage protein D [Brucella anthropi]
MARRAIYQVKVAGQDISSKLLPILISLETTDKEGSSSDTASISIDDKDQVIRFPKTGDPMSVSFGWEGEGLSVVFTGTVDEVQSSGSRGGGRVLSISAKGIDTQSKVKQHQHLNIDKANLETALKKAGEQAGITDIKVDDELAGIERDWWGLDGESFIAFAERTAREVGGIFKIQGNKAAMVSKTGGAASGAAMPTITAAWGVNLIAWDIRPVTGRPRHKTVKARYYDRKEAKWKEAEASVQNEDDVLVSYGKKSGSDEGDAVSTSKGKAKEVERDKGGGTVEIDGTALARPGGTCIISGARAGVDGSYRIEEVSHSYSNSGWTTRLTVKLPSANAGKDTRSPKKPTKKSSGSSGSSGGASVGGDDILVPS